MKVEVGHNVQVHYVGTFPDGTEFDNSRTRGFPMSFQVGDTRMIRGFSQNVVGMDEGQTINFTLSPEEAYGERNPLATREVPITEFEGIDVEVGGMIRGNGPTGPFLAQITAVEGETVTIDMNHPLAGKELNFEVELVANTGTKIFPEDPVPNASEVADETPETTEEE